MIQDRIHTHQDFSWVALTLPDKVINSIVNPVPNFLFMMNPHKPTKYQVFLDKNEKPFFTFEALKYNYNLLQIYGNPVVDVYCDDKHFRTYDLKDSSILERLKICNTLYFKNT